MRRDQLAVSAIDHVHEAVLIRAQQGLARLTIDTQIGKYRLGRAIEVETFIWNVLIVPNQLARFRSDGNDARSIKAIGFAAIGRVVWLRVPRTPVNEIKLEVI
jgi:hypothetical protein